MTVERIRNGPARAELLDFLARHEPQSTWALATMKRLESERQRKAWVVRHEGAIAGVLVSSRYCFDRWTGMLVLPDLQRADEMAWALDHSNVWRVAGPADAIEAVLPRLRRSGGITRTWFYAMPYVATQPAPDGSRPGADGDVCVRQAATRDVNPLAAMYSTENPLRVPGRRFRGAVRRTLRYTIVAEAAEGVIGALVMSAGDTYTMISRAVVRPTLRGGRVAFTLAVRAGLAAKSEGRGICGFRPTENGSPAILRGAGASTDQIRATARATEWVNVSLSPPTRFRGQNRLRDMIEWLEGAVGGAERLVAAKLRTARLRRGP